MSDDVFKQSRKKISADEFSGPQIPQQGEENPLDKVRAMQQAIARETGRDAGEPQQAPRLHSADLPFQVQGNVPPQFAQMLQQRANNPGMVPPHMQGSTQDAMPPQFPQGPVDNDYQMRYKDTTRPSKMAKNRRDNMPVPDAQVVQRNMRGGSNSDEFTRLIDHLEGVVAWEPIELPSKGKFYDSIPGVLHVRPMTGEEEQILATPRFVRKGKAIDMIFQKCIRENIDTQELLSVDRTYLLIFLRGISYTPEYDVEIKCPECTNKYNAVINLDQIEVEHCPDQFDTKALEGVLPTSGFKYKFRLATGDDEQTITRYREQRVKEYGDQNEDDTLLYRTALLLEYIEGVTEKYELNHLLKKLPINDVAHLRNAVSDPPFGVDTQIGQVCPYCTAEFEIDLPLEANFFFPRKKKERTPQ